MAQEDKLPDGMIKTIVGVIITIVLIVGWGVSIGINYQRMNNIEKTQNDYQTTTNDRLDKFAQTIEDGMKLRIQLQKDVENLTKTADRNSAKLDKIIDMFNTHLLQSDRKSSIIEQPYYGYDNKQIDSPNTAPAPIVR